MSRAVACGLPAETAARVADAVVAGFEHVQHVYDETGCMWSQVPMFDEAGQMLPFDRHNTAVLRRAAEDVLSLSPEASAVFAGVVYPSALREAKIARVLWLGRNGEVVAAPDIFNSIDAAMSLMEAMLFRFQQLRDHEEKRLVDILSKMKEAHEQQQAAGQG